MSGFSDDEISCFLQDAIERDEWDDAHDEIYEDNDAAWASALGGALTDQGFTTTVILSEDKFDMPRITVLSTPTSPEIVSESVSQSWSGFTTFLLSARGFAEYGGSAPDDIDSNVLETTTEGLSALLANTDVEPADIQAAIEASNSFLGAQITGAALEVLMLDPAHEISVDPLLSMKRTLAHVSLENTQDQSSLNFEITRTVRPLIQALASEFLPVEHDDFQNLRQAIEVAARVQCSPEYVERVEADEGLARALGDNILSMSLGAVERHALDLEALIAISTAIANFYLTAGYVSQN